MTNRRSFAEVLATIPHQKTFEINGTERTYTFTENERISAAREEIAREADAERAAKQNTSPTVAEVLAILRKPGKVYVPVIVPNDMTYIQAVKADVLEYFAAHGLAPDDASPWYVIEGKGEDHYLADVEDNS